ncbi:hypothetical protein JCM8547_007024 [Rhodosporidiobolus lusitaniae]
MSDSDPSATLATLSASLGDLESALEPLLSKPLSDLVDSAQDEPLVQARAQVLASYIVHDLIWVYLKTAGVEPSNHSVMEEIERLKGYFGKLKQAETGAPPPADPSKPRMQIDRAAANRFISAAINSAKASVDPSYTSTDEASAEAGPSGTHIRFEEDVERLLEDKDEEEDDSEDDAMEVEQALLPNAGAAKVEGASEKGKGKEGTPAGKKRDGKRAAKDPFAGYDQPKPSTPSASSTPSSEKSRKTALIPSAATPASASTPATASAKRKQRDQDGDVAESATGTPAAGGKAGEGSSKKGKKKLKMKGDK